MKKLLLIGCTLLLSLTLCAQEVENITMGIMYKWGIVNTEVAQASLTLEKAGADKFHGRMAVKSAPFFDVFYKMRENFQSWFMAEDFRPMEFIRDTYEGGYTATNHYIYDWKAGVIHSEVCYNKKEPEKLEIPLQGMSYDLVTLVYYLRSIDWVQTPVDEPRIVPFAIDDTIFQVKVTYRGQERITVRRKGKYDALRFSCTVVAGALFPGDQELQVWFSDDDHHIPLAIMVPLKMGTMWAWLKTWEDHRNE